MNNDKVTSGEVVSFWMDDVGPEGWYNPPEGLDEEIRARFEAAWHKAMAGELHHWRQTPRGTLAWLILVDQFPRNMFRGTAQSFASDALARRGAQEALWRGVEQRIEGPARQFFYLPYMHSESTAHQNRSVRLFKIWDSPENLRHARAHRDIIHRFSRFPTRNAALGRQNSAKEEAFLQSGGYGAVLNSLDDL